MWAGGALGRLRHAPALPVLIERLQHRDGTLVDEGTDLAEVPGYMDAVGDFFQPERSDTILLSWAKIRDHGLRDRAARRLSLQSGGAMAGRLEKIASSLSECDPQVRGCVKRNFIQGYIPTLQAAEGCSTVDCWAGKLGDDSWRMRERAAYSLAALTHGKAGEAAQARAALLEAVDDQTPEASTAIIFALDRVSPEGCNGACLTRIRAAAETMRGKTTTKGIGRNLMALQGLLANRSKSGS